MPKEKKSKECECGFEVFGFSDKHAMKNLIIHKSISSKHKQFLELKKKWLKQAKLKQH